jgi:hypothetical protein
VTFAEMLVEMVEGRRTGSPRLPAGAAAVTSLAMALTGAARARVRRQR